MTTITMPTKAEARRDFAPLVVAYVAARTIAETLREKKNGIARAILAGYEMHSRYDGKRITEESRTYEADDEHATKYYALMNAAMRKAGLKPDDMPDEYCPALVAESKLVDVEWTLIKALAPRFGMDPSRVGGRLDFRKQFLDLVCKMTMAE